MLKEALELIQETAQKAVGAEMLHQLSGDGRTAHVRIVIHPYPLDPMPRDHNVETLADLLAYALHEKWVEGSEPVIWHGSEGVVLILNDGDRRDRVTFPLTCSDRIKRLAALRKDRSVFSQAQFVRLLRIDLRLDNLAVVSQFRKLDWTSGDAGRVEVRHGADRLGREISAKVEGVAELPDELDVPTPFYQQAGERTEYLVRCAVEIDVTNQAFQLIPLADEIERVQDLAHADIRRRIDADDLGIPVYYGQP